jgi:tetratricopeptide (TPR) repeat protein
MKQDLRGPLHAWRLAVLSLAVAYLATAATGCSELRGRRRIREGNRLYREGSYAEALQQFKAAEPFVPHLPQVWRGEGLACRQMMIPGAKSAENDRAIDCALAAFDRLRRLGAGDAPGEALYIQTLFDGDRFETLTSLFQERLRTAPADLGAVNGLIQTYSRWNRMDEALAAYEKRAALRPNDAESQYAVGVYIWQQLFQRGGGPDKAAFDPRIDPNAPEAAAAATSPAVAKAKGRKGRRQGKKKGAPPPPAPVKQAPAFALGDIVSSQRIALSDLGIKYLERALVLRPKYREALIYMNLLFRQKSLAYFNNPAEWQACIDAAEKWRAKAEADVPKEAPKDAPKDVVNAPKGGPGPR